MLVKLIIHNQRMILHKNSWLSIQSRWSLSAFVLRFEFKISFFHSVRDFTEKTSSKCSFLDCSKQFYKLVSTPPPSHRFVKMISFHFISPVFKHMKYSRTLFFAVSVLIYVDVQTVNNEGELNLAKPCRHNLKYEWHCLVINVSYLTNMQIF